MAHRSFIRDDSEPRREAPTFDLGGIRTENGEAWKETFTCLPEAPSGVLDDLTTSSLLDDKGNRVFNAPSLLAFFEGVLIAEDVHRFRELTHDKDRIVTIEQLGDVMMWLSEEITGRPTQR